MVPASKLLRLTSALLLTGLASCAHLSGGVSPSTMPMGNRDYDSLGPVAGTSSVVYLFGVLPISGSNSTRDAMEDALAQKPGTDALIQVSADTSSYFFILWTQDVITVEGTAVKFK
jgi:hypothetical protein